MNATVQELTQLTSSPGIQKCRPPCALEPWLVRHPHRDAIRAQQATHLDARLQIAAARHQPDLEEPRAGFLEIRPKSGGIPVITNWRSRPRGLVFSWPLESTLPWLTLRQRVSIRVQEDLPVRPELIVLQQRAAIMNEQDPAAVRGRQHLELQGFRRGDTYPEHSDHEKGESCRNGHSKSSVSP